MINARGWADALLALTSALAVAVRLPHRKPEN